MLVRIAYAAMQQKIGRNASPSRDYVAMQRKTFPAKSGISLRCWTQKTESGEESSQIEVRGISSLNGRAGKLRSVTVLLLIGILGAFGFGCSTVVHAKPPGRAEIVVDANSGEVLAARQSEVTWHPASLTKMMTLYQVFSALDRRKITLKSKIKISRNAAGQPPSKLGLKPGSTISVELAIEALAIKSANDVAVAVAEGLAGSEKAFAVRMTKTARHLGMSRTTFRNASGLHHSKQITTARDMAILSIALIRDFPRYYRYFSQKDFRYQRIRHASHNYILNSYDGADGIKTGYIAKSGFNLAASAKHGSKRIVAVVLGASSTEQRTAIMRGMLDEGFDDLKRKKRKRVARALPVRLNNPPLPPRRESTRVARWPDTIPLPRLSPQRRHESLVVSRAPTVPAAPARAASSSAAGSYAIQVGAFRTPDLAQRQLNDVLNALPAGLASASPLIISFHHPSRGTFYRARLVGYETRRAASATCHWLMEQRTDCAVVTGSS
jgi:D-alanyl-D-alanine carboxypeptidase